MFIKDDGYHNTSNIDPLEDNLKYDENSQLCCTLKKKTSSLEPRLQTGYPGRGFSQACYSRSYIRFWNNAFNSAIKTLVSSPVWFTIHDFIASYSTARIPAGDTMLINGVSLKFLQLILNGGLWYVVIEKSVYFPILCVCTVLVSKGGTARHF